MGWEASPVEVATRREGRGVIRSTAWAVLVLGVEGAGPPSSSISKSSSPSDPDSSAIEAGASGLGGGVGRARHSLEKASCSQPELGQWGGGGRAAARDGPGVASLWACGVLASVCRTSMVKRTEGA